MRRTWRASRRGGSLPPPPASPAPIAEQVKLLQAAAEIHLRKRKAPADAIPVLERAAQLVPHDRELLLALCDAYNAAQRGREAAQVLERVIASFGNRRTKELALYHHRLARALAQLGDKDVALAQLDMAFKIDPGSVTVLKDLGVLAFETNDLDRAQKTFRALLLQRLDAERRDLEGRGLLLPGRDQRQAGRQGEGRADVRARDRERSVARARTHEADGAQGLTSRGRARFAALALPRRGSSAGRLARLWLATLRVRVVATRRSRRVARPALGARVLARDAVAAARVAAAAARRSCS